MKQLSFLASFELSKEQRIEFVKDWMQNPELQRDFLAGDVKVDWLNDQISFTVGGELTAVLLYGVLFLRA